MVSSDPGGEPAPLLLVDDDRRLVELLRELFVASGYAVDHAADGQRALHLGLTRTYAVVVLDRRIPVIDGLDLLALLRRRGMASPVLVLSGLGTTADRIEGLDAGADDYLAKPFDVDELLARVRALHRRHLDRADVLPVGPARLHLATREVVAADRRVRLSPRECDLLATFAARPDRVFRRDELMRRVFVDAEDSVVVDTYVHYLRRKLGRGVVSTVRGRGFRLGSAP